MSTAGLHADLHSSKDPVTLIHAVVNALVHLGFIFTTKAKYCDKGYVCKQSPDGAWASTPFNPDCPEVPSWLTPEVGDMAKKSNPDFLNRLTIDFCSILQVTEQ